MCGEQVGCGEAVQWKYGITLALSVSWLFMASGDDDATHLHRTNAVRLVQHDNVQLQSFEARGASSMELC